MNAATATGFAMNAVCEPSMVSVVAAIRWAINVPGVSSDACSCQPRAGTLGMQPAGCDDQGL